VFARRELAGEALDEDHFFVADVLAAGEAVVTHGVQALPAEELRWSIPAEDDD
jgi:hypothetical protein